MLFYVNEKTEEMPKDFRCPQNDILVINEECNVLTCCALDRNHAEYSLGSVFDFSIEKIRDLKSKQKVCNKCLKIGLSYLAHNPLILEKHML